MRQCLLVSLLVSLGAASSSAAAQQDANTYFMSAGDTWGVVRNNGACLLIGIYDRGSALNVGYDRRKSQVTVRFTDPSIRSLKDGDTRKLSITFVRAGHVDDGWGEKDFFVGIGDDGETSFIRYFDAQFLDDLASSETLAFFFGKAVVQAFALKGSREAVAQLHSCALDEMRKHPTDPFE